LSCTNPAHHTANLAFPAAYPARPAAYPARPAAYPARPAAYPARPATFIIVIRPFLLILQPILLVLQPICLFCSLYARPAVFPATHWATNIFINIFYHRDSLMCKILLKKVVKKYAFLHKFHQAIFVKNEMHNSAKDSRAECCCTFC